MHALLLIELGHPVVLAGRDGLARADFDAQLVVALLAQRGVEEDHVVGVASRGLDLAADEERVLVGDQQLAVVGNRGPAAAVHQSLVQGFSRGCGFPAKTLDLLGGDLAPVVIGQRGKTLPGWHGFAGKIEPTSGQTGQAHAGQALEETLLETVARPGGLPAFLVHPAVSPSLHIGPLQILPGEGSVFPQKLDHALGQLRSGGPGLVHARAGQHVGAAGALADARVPVPGQKGFAELAGLLEGFGPPGAHGGTLQVGPQGRVHHPVLQIAVPGPRRAVQPGGDEDPQRGLPVGVHVEEAENLRLGIAEGVPHGPRLERARLGQVHHHLHAHGPVPLVVAGGQPEVLVQVPAHGSDRAVSHHGQAGADVHAGQVPGRGVSGRVGALVDQAHPDDSAFFDQRLVDRHPRPELHQAGAHQLGPDPLVELTDGEYQPALFAQEGRNVGQLDGVLLVRQCPPERADPPVEDPEAGRAPAGPEGVQQVEHLLPGHRVGHGDLGGVQVRKGGADAAGPTHHPRHAEADVFGPLVADHLQRHAGHDLAGDRRLSALIHQGPGERGQKSAHGRAEPDAGDIHLHTLPLGVVRIGQFSSVVQVGEAVTPGSPGLRESSSG